MFRRSTNAKRCRRKMTKKHWNPETCYQQMKALDNALQKERKQREQGNDFDRELEIMADSWEQGMIRNEINERDEDEDKEELCEKKSYSAKRTLKKR